MSTKTAADKISPAAFLAGKLEHIEKVVEGLDKASHAFLGQFKSENIIVMTLA